MGNIKNGNNDKKLFNSNSPFYDKNSSLYNNTIPGFENDNDDDFDFDKFSGSRNLSSKSIERFSKLNHYCLLSIFYEFNIIFFLYNMSEHA